MSGQPPPPVFGCVKAQESMLGMLMSTNLKMLFGARQNVNVAILANSQGKKRMKSG